MEEFQDGLELSLGLGLSRNNNNNSSSNNNNSSSSSKWKNSAINSEGTSAAAVSSLPASSSSAAAAASTAAPADLIADPNTPVKPKLQVPSKASGLDAALKKFLQGRLDEQDETGKLLDGSSSFAKPNSASGSASASASGNSFQFTEIPVSSALGGSRAQSPPHPLQFDAFKIGSPQRQSPDAGAHCDPDDPEALEQQRKFQEARRKRKQLVEEQKVQKKGKKDEDKPVVHGFRRPGSNTWVPGLDPSLNLAGSDAGEREGNRQGSPDTDKGYETDENDSTGIDHNESPGAGDVSKGFEVNFMPRLQAQDVDTKGSIRTEEDILCLGSLQSQGKESSFKGTKASILPSNQQEGQLSPLTIGRRENVGPHLTRDREKVPSETSSTGTDGTEHKEEKIHGGAGDVSSAKAEFTAGDKMFLGSSASPFHPNTATATTALPYQMQQFPVAPGQYSVPMPGATVPGTMSFQTHFPYHLQHGPLVSDGQEQSSMRPMLSSQFQPGPGIEYPPQLGSTEGTSWTQVLRPTVVSPFNNTNNGPIYSRSSMGAIEDGNKRPQGATVHENGSGQNVSLTVDGSAHGQHPFFRSVPQNGTQDPVAQLQRATDIPMLSNLSVPAAQQFGSQHGLPDSELRPLKDQTGMNSFPGFAASVQSMPGLPGSLRPSSSGMKEDGGQEQTKFGGKLDSAAMLQQIHQRNGADINNPGQEDFRRALGGQFNQGSTENLSISESLGDEIVNLQPGLAPNLKFGGTGTAPDLPWVHTTGPNGQTIGGVLYKLNQNQLRIVCACHGKHMSPTEFGQHAATKDVSN